MCRATACKLSILQANLHSEVLVQQISPCIMTQQGLPDSTAFSHKAKVAHILQLTMELILGPFREVNFRNGAQELQGWYAVGV
jgi:hypothetical protein